MTKTALQFLFWGYILILILFFIYTFIQVDLGLTLSKFPSWQGIQKSLQHIGYFQRPLSTAMYVLLLTLVTSFYLVFVSLAKKGHLTRKFVWKTILATTLLLTFSYNAFSYDLFNYIFDAKIVTHYHLNPYEYRALDFKGDPMLLFMHWTHRTYPYGPMWLALTVPLSYIGLGYFIVTFFLFKLLAATTFLGSVYIIEKIVGVIRKESTLVSVVLFALNPLVLIESLVSAHNDIPMLFFALVAFYFLLVNNFAVSYLMLITSIGIKFATAFLAPFFLIRHFLGREKYIANGEKIVVGMILALCVAVLMASYRTNFQPWYLLFVLPFAAIIGYKYFIQIPFIILTIAATLLYIPYLYLGNWDTPIPVFLDGLMVMAVEVSVVVVIAQWISNARNQAKQNAKPRPSPRHSP